MPQVLNIRQVPGFSGSPSSRRLLAGAAMTVDEVRARAAHYRTLTQREDIDPAIRECLLNLATIYEAYLSRLDKEAARWMRHRRRAKARCVDCGRPLGKMVADNGVEVHADGLRRARHLHATGGPWRAPPCGWFALRGLCDGSAAPEFCDHAIDRSASDSGTHAERIRERSLSDVGRQAPGAAFLRRSGRSGGGVADTC